MSAFTKNLPHTCTIRRPVISRSAIGEVVKNYIDVSTAQQCRLIIKEETRPAEEQSLQKRTVYTLLFPAGADVLGVDQVANIVTEDAITEPGPFKIEALLPRRLAAKIHHLSAKLERV